MIYRHDDADEASAVMHYHAAKVERVGKLADRVLCILAACILVPLVLHMVLKHWGAL